jgi:hypothetical protein
VLTHLDPDMVQFLHAQELSEVCFTLFFIVLQVVDVFEAEVFELLLERLDHVLELLHGIRMLLHKLLD